MLPRGREEGTVDDVGAGAGATFMSSRARKMELKMELC